MYTHHRLRYATRWNRRLAFALVVVLLLALTLRAYRAWQRAYPPKPEPLGTQV